jgi:CheY-like chemotaxis protein
VEAESGEHARKLLATDRHFDVIFCDIMMPEVTGMDLHRWLIDHDPQLAKRVVFVTGGAFTPETKAYLDGVENLTIEKPFDIEIMRKILAENVEYGNASESNQTA